MLRDTKAMKNQPGYILVLTLMIISVLVVMVTGVFYNGTAQLAFNKTIVEREKAKILALSGVEIAVSRLIVPDEKKEKQNSTQQQGKSEARPQNNKAKKFLQRILPALNRWQVFNLKDDVDGIDGQIKVCISCEEGKININELYDFKEHKFKFQKDPKEGSKQLFEDVFNKMSEFVQEKDLFYNFHNHLSKSKFPFNDVTELLSIPKFNYFYENLFYNPSDNQNKIFLTDIFTIYSTSKKVQPWLLSDSLCALWGLKRAKSNDLNERAELVNEWVKEFKESTDWSKEWDKSLKKVYGKSYSNLSKIIQNFLDEKFAPKIFCVISYGTFGIITQRIIAILELDYKNNSGNYTIKKLYWN